VKSQQSGVILLAHGSRAEAAQRKFAELVQNLDHSLPSVSVQGAALRSEPGFFTAVDRLVDKGIDTVLFIPLFVFPGKHVRQDVPRLIEEAKNRYPGVEFTSQNCLASGDDFARLIAAKIQTGLPEIQRTSGGDLNQTTFPS